MGKLWVRIALAALCNVWVAPSVFALQCTLKVGKDVITLYEPVSMGISLTNDNAEELDVCPVVGLSGGLAVLQMRSRDEPWGDVRTVGGLRNLCQVAGDRMTLRPGESVDDYELVAWSVDERSYLFSAPGTYQLRVVHRAWSKTGARVEALSNVCEVECRDISEAERAPAQIWNQEANYLALAEILHGDPVPDALRLVTEFPRSVYAQYAQAVLRACHYTVPDPLYPDDERLAVVVEYEFPEWTSVRDVLAIWQKQSGVALRVVDALASRRRKCGRKAEPLREAMQHYQSGDTVWRPDGEGYLLMRVDREKVDSDQQ